MEKNKKRSISFDWETRGLIQNHANIHYDGNFTASVIHLTRLALGAESEQRVEQKVQGKEESGGIQHIPC